MRHIFFALVLSFAAAGCAPDSGSSSSTRGRVQNINRELTVESVSGMGVSAQLVSLGAIFLEAQLAPPTSAVAALQASDLTTAGPLAYVAYSAFDTGGEKKAGGIDVAAPVLCDNLLTLTHTEYCLGLNATFGIADHDIFSLQVSGSNLYAVGASQDETYLPDFARLLKISLSALVPTAITNTVVLPSYAGTGVLVSGANIYTTSGTSTTPAQMGGLSVVNASTLTKTSTTAIYDARAVSADPANANRIYVINGKTDASNASSVREYDISTGTPSLLRTIAVGGNTIPESKSGILVGNQLLIASLGDGGFKVLCKSSGATLATQAAVTVSGIPAAKTVTNSVAAIPGYLFAANGEAGVYVYKFTKTNLLSSNYCNGVTLSLVGRLRLDSDNSDLTYLNAELSANAIKSATILNVLNVISARFLYVASGNKGISLLNVSDVSLLSGGVDDFP